MRIMLLEMKKIWNVRLLAAIAIICMLFYIILMSFYIANYPNGHQFTEDAEFSTYMVQKYGATLEEDEFADLLKIKEGLNAELEQIIKDNPVFAEAGITSYADYERIRQGDSTEEEEKRAFMLFGEEYGFIGFKLQSLGTIIENYERRTEWIGVRMEHYPQNSAVYKRLSEIRDTGEYNNIMDYQALENTKIYLTMLTVLSILCTLILVSPLVVTDRSRKTNLLQYTARKGRRILTSQLAAVIASSLLMTTMLLSVFGFIYSGLGIQIYWNQGLTSFFSSETMQVPITFGQYIILMVLLMYLLSAGAAFISFLLSRFSQNTIALIMKLLPVLAVMVFVSITVLTNFLCMGRLWLEPAAVILIFLLSMSAAIFVLRRERRVDVL